MFAGGNLVGAARLAWDFIAFAREPQTLEAAEAMVRARLAGRDEHFLRCAKARIFDNPASPYHRLLAACDCSFEDLQQLVVAQGLQGALQRLRDAGVYLTYEEFKGRRDVVRGSLRFSCNDAAFDNQMVRAQIRARTGGSTGQSVSAPMDLRFIEFLSSRKALLYKTYRLDRLPAALWLPGPPDVVWLRELLYEMKLGLPPVHRWFAVTPPNARGVPAIAAAAVAGLGIMGRAMGHPIPRPEYTPLEASGVVARWMAGAISQQGSAYLRTNVSLAIAVANAAADAGLDLAGGVFHTSGEPMSKARRAHLEASGASVIPIYGAEELGGPAGYGCAEPLQPDDVHLFTDQFAVITHRREHDGQPVESLLFTSLHLYAPKVLLNVEIDDTGVLEERDCGCFLGNVGLRTHLHSIRSFGKVTAFGRAVMGADIGRILEEVLPGRFGGSPTGYQLVEEAEEGTARLTLLVSPAAGEIDEAEVLRVLLSELGKGRPAYQATATLWNQVKALSVQRRPPYVTWRGKVHPYHLAGSRHDGEVHA